MSLTQAFTHGFRTPKNRQLGQTITCVRAYEHFEVQLWAVLHAVEARLRSSGLNVILRHDIANFAILDNIC